jgi:Cu(I)/Ag(I) efflux system membrane protein CusA/SilA
MVAGGPARDGVVERVIGACAKNPFFTIFAAAVFGVWGWWAIRQVPLDAIPDLSDTQVIVFTEWEGQSPDLVEDQITYPITTSLVSAPKVEFVRGQSFLGLSFVYVIFEDGTDIYWARSRVLEYLNGAQAKLPPGVRPTLGPDATGVGWVFQYALLDKTGTQSLADLRSFQDWYLRYWLESVDGVAEVASVGGFIKQYQVNLDPDKLLALGIPVGDVVSAIRRSNADVGGRVLEIAGHEHFVRGRGYISSTSDLETIPLKVGDNGVPITIRDVATVDLGPDDRRGVADLDGEGEVVGGIVVMRYGENALAVINRVKERLDEVRASLPEGVELEIVYDRSELILRAIDTLRETLFEEMVVVSLVVAVFLLHARSALVAILTLPLAVLMSFIPMYYQGITANIMSLGGIAVAIGEMVDAAIVIVENAHRKLEHAQPEDEPSRRTLIVDAMQEVGPSIFFSLLVMTVSFLPVFTLQGVEGRLFSPLAFTKTYSMLFASLLSVTLIPALAVLVVRGRIRREDDHLVTRWLIAWYTPVVRATVRHRRLVMATAFLAVVATVPAFMSLGSEFMPPLHEGSILYMPSAMPGMSITEASAILQTMDRELKSFPEVQTVFGKIGRSQSATDPAPMSMVETVVVLKPESEWRPDMDWDTLIAEMNETLRYPGMPNVWWMPVQTRTEMLATGIRSALGIKVFGPDLATIEQVAVDVERALLADPRTAPHTRSAFAERVTGGYFVDLEVDRLAAARHGLTVDDVEEVIGTAIGGMNVAETIEGRERYPINVRYARDFREDPDALPRVFVPTPHGQVPLGQVAKIDFETGPPMIRQEDGQLVNFVFVDVTGKPIADYVEAAKEVVAEHVTLPPGYRLAWAGQFQYLERARARLLIVVPLTLVIVCLLLYLNTGSVIEMGIVFLAVPFSLVGAIWLFWLLGYNMSVASWVGLIALAGLDAETGVVMLLYLRIVWERRMREGSIRTEHDLEDAIVEGAAGRIRPKLMTVLTTMIGLLPIMWSTGTGADVMQRIAAPLVGGVVTSFLLELTVYPAIFAAWRGRSVSPAGG